MCLTIFQLCQASLASFYKPPRMHDTLQLEKDLPSEKPEESLPIC